MRILPFLALSLLLLPSFASASVLRCHADFDEGSYYTLEAELAPDGVRGDVHLSYVTDDGLDLKQDLAVEAFSYHPGEVLRLKAKNEYMGAALDGVEVVPGMGLVARLILSFSLDHAEPLDLDANCELK